MTMKTYDQPTSADVCAYYGRVSTRRQKLEHQREAVDRFLEQSGIVIPLERRFEDKERRHKSQKRERFQDLLKMCQDCNLNWIVIATFDRWGVADVDEFFEFRGRLRKCHVRLWSVNDHLELTGCEDADYFRIISQAVACTSQMASHADRNIMKMVQMAQDGWHASASVPFGMDLICCPLSDKTHVLFRVHTLARPKDGKALYTIIFPDGRKEASQRMPLRDCKQTGYRLVPSIDIKRVEAVRMIHELYDSGMSWHDMRRHLRVRGYSHYGHPFQDNAMLTILQNPAYIGKPAWGKYAIGHYRQVFNKSSSKPRQRKRDEPAQYYKDEEHFVFPRETIFDPETFVPLKLWERVQISFLEKKKLKVNRPRRRNRMNHPLNGKVVCPDCGSLMVTGRCKNRKGEAEHYYICGQYAKTQHISCRANTTKWKKLETASEEWLGRVRQDLGELSQIDLTDADVLHRVKEWSASWKLLCDVVIQMLHELGIKPSAALLDAAKRESISAIGREYGKVQRQYETLLKKQGKNRDKELHRIDGQIDKVGRLIEELPPGLYKQTKLTKLAELEQQRQRLMESPQGLLEQFQTAVNQTKVLASLMSSSMDGYIARLWDALLHSVTPIMRQEAMRNGKTRTFVTGFRFQPNTVTAEALNVLEIPCSRRGTD